MDVCKVTAFEFYLGASRGRSIVAGVRSRQASAALPDGAAGGQSARKAPQALKLLPTKPTRSGTVTPLSESNLTQRPE